MDIDQSLRERPYNSCSTHTLYDPNPHNPHKHEYLIAEVSEVALTLDPKTYGGQEGLVWGLLLK